MIGTKPTLLESSSIDASGQTSTQKFWEYIWSGFGDGMNNIYQYSSDVLHRILYLYVWSWEKEYLDNR